MRLLPKLARYTAVSAISSALSWTILGVLVLTGATTAGWANVLATAAGTVPSFELNRRWVWGKRGSRSLLAEVGPFTVLSFTGLALSTVAVSVAAGWASAAGLGTTARAIAAEAASIATFGTLWVAQYLLLDRVLFAPAVHGARRAAGAGCEPTGAGPRTPDGDETWSAAADAHIRPPAGRGPGGRTGRGPDPPAAAPRPGDHCGSLMTRAAAVAAVGAGVSAPPASG